MSDKKHKKKKRSKWQMARRAQRQDQRAGGGRGANDILQVTINKSFYNNLGIYFTSVVR